MSDRAALSARKIPFMTLSDGSPSSLTAPPAPLPDGTPTVRAAARFAITGNAVLTGGAGTLALSAARALLEHGIQGIALLDLPATLHSSSSAIDSLKSSFPDRNILTQAADVTNPTAVTQAFDSALAKLNTITHLLCFAGIVGCHHALDMTYEQWTRTLEVNTTGSFLCAQAAARVMRRQVEEGTGYGGSIVFTASISAHRVNFPQPQAAYNVSKASLVALKNSLAAEWARYGIRVNSISPGYMDTVLNEGDGLEEARNVWASRNPMGRMGAIGELDGLVVLLCSRAGSYINGADFVVDGGAVVF